MNSGKLIKLAAPNQLARKPGSQVAGKVSISEKNNNSVLHPFERSTRFAYLAHWKWKILLYLRVNTALRGLMK